MCFFHEPLLLWSLRWLSPPSVCGPRVSGLCGSRRPHPWSPWSRPSSACGRRPSASCAPSRCPHLPDAPAAPDAVRWADQLPAWRRATLSPVSHIEALRKRGEQEVGFLLNMYIHYIMGKKIRKRYWLTYYKIISPLKYWWSMDKLIRYKKHRSWLLTNDVIHWPFSTTPLHLLAQSLSCRA